MLKELTRADWLGMLELDDRDVPAVLILRGTRNLRTRYEFYRDLFEDVIDVGSPNGLFEDVFIGNRNGMRIGYASVYGPAMASEIAHVFGVLGTRRVIQTGVCGGLADGLNAGDVFVAERAGCGDGASICYLPGASVIEATPALVAAAREHDAESHPIRSGAMWTTAALLAEGEADVEVWHGQGFGAVDLETAATFAVAEFFGMERAAVLSVFDNPRHGVHLGMTEHDKRDARDRGEAVVLDIVLGLATNAG